MLIIQKKAQRNKIIKDKVCLWMNERVCLLNFATNPAENVLNEDLLFKKVTDKNFFSLFEQKSIYVLNKEKF